MSNSRLYKRDQVWWAQFYLGPNRRVRRSTRCIDKRAAEAVLRRWERELHEAPTEKQRHTVGQALAYMLESGTNGLSEASKSFYDTKAAWLVLHLGTIEVDELTQDDVQRYIDTRGKEVKPRTIAKELSALHKTLDIAHRRKVNGQLLMRQEPSAVFPKFQAKYTPVRRWLTHEEFDKLMGKYSGLGDRTDVLEDHRKLWLWVGCYTGGRLSELRDLIWEDVRLDTHWLILNGRKTEEAWRWIPIAAKLHAVLASVPAKDRKGRVLASWQNPSRDLVAASDRARIPRFSMNDVRRTFGSWLRQQGVDSATVAKLMGHTTSAMVEKVYGRLNDQALVRAMGVL